MRRLTTAVLALAAILLAGSDGLGASQQEKSKHAIVPGVGVGDYTLEMSKGDVLKKLGEPDTIHLGLGEEGEEQVIHRGEEKYSLKDLPSEYVLAFGDVSFWIEDDSVQAIFVRSPLYKLSNGLGVGDSEQKIKQAFGEDFQPREVEGKDFICYDAKGLGFEIHKKNQTVAEIVVYSSKDLAARIRQAAAEGRLARQLTTPGEFKAIAGQPTKEWTEQSGDIIGMEYPGIEVRFFGKPNLDTPHTLFDVECEGRHIDFGDGGIVLRNEGDLEKFGPFWGYSGVDLSRLDLSQKGKLLEARPFDNRTVWPKSDLLPPGFDPKRRLEWGKNPGLGVRSLHQEGITGKGVGIAVIDMPLLREHVEYADRIRSYHTTDVEATDAKGHGTSVCSIAVGKTCGVAPQASLHYCAVPTWKWAGSNRGYARTVEQIVERNRHLSPSEKVRVISLSIENSSRDHYDQWRAAVDKAKKKGILVVTCEAFRCIKRKVRTDPDDPNNYGPSHLFGDGNAPVYVPIANRSRATEEGKDAYTFDTRGGDSWGAPYLAGLAALAFQVYPEISPDEIVKLWKETATRTELCPVVNPRGFIEAVKRLKASVPR